MRASRVSRSVAARAVAKTAPPLPSAQDRGGSGRPPRAPAPLHPAPAARPAHAAGAITDGLEALQIILTTPRKRADGKRDGGRHLNIGRSGCGKSYLTAAILGQLDARQLARWTFILDDKDPRNPNYDQALYFETVADFERAAEAPEADGVEGGVVAFSGNVDQPGGQRVDPESFAQLCQRFAQAGVPTCGVWDEYKRAATDGGRSWVSQTAKWLLTESRSLGFWQIACAQHGKQVPDEGLNESSTIAVFGQKARAARYLVDLLDLDPAVAARIPQLGEGEFVLFVDEQDWNGKIYKL